MSKIIALILVISMIAVALVSCTPDGNDGESTPAVPENTPAASEPSEVTDPKSDASEPEGTPVTPESTPEVPDTEAPQPETDPETTKNSGGYVTLPRDEF